MDSLNVFSNGEWIPFLEEVNGDLVQKCYFNKISLFKTLRENLGAKFQVLHEEHHLTILDGSEEDLVLFVYNYDSLIKENEFYFESNNQKIKIKEIGRI